jgi:hypothetical protein
MKKIGLAILAASCSFSVNALDVGLGAGVGNWDSEYIYVPININSDFRVEPYLYHYKYDTDYKNPAVNDYNYSSTEVGLGLFKVNPAAESINVLIGARLGYYEYESDWGPGSYSDSDGYSIAPTLGFEYFMAPNLSVGAEASWIFSKGDGKDSSSGKWDDEDNRTTTAVTMKYYFQ